MSRVFAKDMKIPYQQKLAFTCGYNQALIDNEIQGSIELQAADYYAHVASCNEMCKVCGGHLIGDVIISHNPGFGNDTIYHYDCFVVKNK